MGSGVQGSLPDFEGTAHVGPHPGTTAQRGTICPRHVASHTALGAVLQQEQDGQLCIIGYASRALTNAKRRYCITRKEFLGVVYGLKKYRHLLG